MKTENKNVEFAYKVGELSGKVMDYLALAELSDRPAGCDGVRGAARRFLGDESQEEFVASRLRLNLWRVCGALGGWGATTDFSGSTELRMALRLDAGADADLRDRLSAAVADWICMATAREACSLILADDRRACELEDMAEVARQRVMMTLCAAETLMKAG